MRNWTPTPACTHLLSAQQGRPRPSRPASAAPTPLDILIPVPSHQHQKVSAVILHLPLAGFPCLCFPVPFLCLQPGSSSPAPAPAPHALPAPILHPSTVHTWLSPGPPEMPGLHASSPSCLLLSQMFFSPQLPGDHSLAAQTLNGGFQWFLLGALYSFSSVAPIATPQVDEPQLGSPCHPPFI